MRIICSPYLAANDRKAITLLAITGAFVFVISSLKIPSVTGSCSHMTGTGLGAILFGPCVTSILGLIVLVFQAILLAHGGLTTLGANCFSMAIAGPIVSWVIYRALKKTGVNKKVTIFLAAFFGDLFTYCVTSVELAAAYHAGGFAAALVIFMITAFLLLSRESATQRTCAPCESMWNDLHEPTPKCASIPPANRSRSSSGTNACTVPPKPPP